MKKLHSLNMNIALIFLCCIIIASKRLKMKLYEKAYLCTLAGIDHQTFKAFEAKIADLCLEEIKKSRKSASGLSSGGHQSS